MARKLAALPQERVPQFVAVDPEVMLANTWDWRQDLTGWLASEKWDGVRVLWTGDRFLSRKGNVYQPPEWWRKGMPHYPLDGEGWLGHGRHYECSGIWRSTFTRVGGEEFRPMRFCVFDAPDVEGPLEKRLEVAQKRVRGCDYALFTQQLRIPSNEGLIAVLDEVEAQGGEGLIARRPQSRYYHHRSDSMLKVVRLYTEEGVVVGYEPGKRGIEGVCGSLEIRLKDGVVCNAGTGLTFKQRQRPPDLGAVVTIRHKGRIPNEGNKPREPRFVSARDYE